ncbi:MAG: BON domain-containing protein [Rhodoferax sp.]
MTTDAEMRTDLLDRLDNIPSVRSADLDVFVDNGMVTLNGHVDTHQARFEVESVAKRIAGLRGLKNNLKPRPTWDRRWT